MNSRSSINETNLVNYSAELSTLNQLDTKDGLLSFPFDHIYACHSDASNRRPTLQLDKEVEVATHCVVGDDKSFARPSEFHKLQEQLNSFENQNKRLKDLLIYHLDLIQQQNELISKRDKLYQTLKQENDALKAKLMRSERRVAISPRTQALNAAYHASKPTSTVTSGSADAQPSTSEIVLNSFSELLLPSHGGLPDLTPLRESFGIARLTATPEQIAAYTQDPDLDMKNIFKSSLGTNKMVDNKRSLIKKEVRKELKAESARTGALGTKTANSRKPAAQKNPRKRRSSGGVTAASRTKNKPATATATATATSTATATATATSTITQYDDPYQLREDDMREQSPIQKLVLKPNNKKRSNKFFDLDNKKNSYQHYEEPGKIILDDADLEIVKTEPDIDWSIYNKTDSFGFFNEGENLSSSLPSLDANEFQELFTSDVALDNLDNLDSINSLDYPTLDEQTKTRVGRLTTLMELDDDVNAAAKLRAINNRARKRGFMTAGQLKQKKGNRKPSEYKDPLEDSQSPPPGLSTYMPYHTVIGDPDLSWYVGLDPDVKLDDIEPAGGQLDTVEVPRWREKPYVSSYTLEGTENLNEKVFEKRHMKLEAEERRQLRWHMRRIREQRHTERLRLRHRDEWHDSPVSAPAVYSLWPRPATARDLVATRRLPAAALGERLPRLPAGPFKLPWVRTSKALKRAKRSKTLH